MLHLLSLAVFTVVHFLHTIDAQKNTNFINLPGDGDGNSYLNDILKSEETDYTICMWFGNIDTTKEVFFELPLLKLTTTNRNLISLVFNINKQGNVSYMDTGFTNPYLCHQPLQFCGSFPQWLHICGVLLKGKTPLFYTDGVQQLLNFECVGIYNGTFYGGTEVPYYFYLGAKPDTIKRSVYRLNIWNKALKDTEISDLAKCKSTQEGSVIAWSDLLNNINGSFEKATGEGPCPHKATKFYPTSYDKNYKPIKTIDCESIEPEQSETTNGSDPSSSNSTNGSSGMPSGSDPGSSSSPSGSSQKPSGSDPGSSSSPSGSSQKPSGSDPGSSSSPSGSLQKPSGSDPGSSSSPSGSSQKTDLNLGL